MPAPVILVVGRDGQVGHALVPALSPLGRVVAVSRAECDLSDEQAIARAIDATKPDVIVNAAAYTAVDRAECDRAAAFALNATAPGILATLAEERGAILIHYSTDYVFDGAKPTPYCEDDVTNPQSVYGASKRDGEVAVRRNLARHFILRTSWVFSDHGTNFLKTMLRLANERQTLSVVADQIGAPTSAPLIAEVTARLVSDIVSDRPRLSFGTYHLSATGETSWHGYATYLIARARTIGMPIKMSSDAIQQVSSASYAAAALRPSNSRLDTARLRERFGIELPPWQDGVDKVLEALARA